MSVSYKSLFISSRRQDIHQNGKCLEEIYTDYTDTTSFIRLIITAFICLLIIIYGTLYRDGKIER